MATSPNHSISQRTEAIYRNESRRVLATLIRLLGDFDLAEEALHDAFTAALQQWPEQGLPENPLAWLVSAGRFKAIDRLRRQARFKAHLADIADTLENQQADSPDMLTHTIEDDMLRLIFTCCHPALPDDAQVALTLREVCGLTTEEIASAFLQTPATVAQRIVRAKASIRNKALPYELPAPQQLTERLESVLRIVYLVFNEGYFASGGDSLTRPGLALEAIRLARLLAGLLPHPETTGLLALLLLQESRSAARTDAGGAVILLQDQDRSRWNHPQIAEACALVRQALQSRRFGIYTIQAAIAAVHAETAEASATDWNEIVGLYDVLLQLQASPVVELNRAVAIAMRDGAEAGLVLIEDLLGQGQLSTYALAHSAHAELCHRCGRPEQAMNSWKRALTLTRMGPEQQQIQDRIRQLEIELGHA